MSGTDTPVAPDRVNHAVAPVSRGDVSRGDVSRGDVSRGDVCGALGVETRDPLSSPRRGAPKEGREGGAHRDARSHSTGAPA